MPRIKNAVVSASRLRMLAEKANRAHRLAQGAARQEVKYAVEAGEPLLKAKEDMGHGDFTKWLKENFDGTPRNARRYMRLARAAAQERIDPDQHDSMRQAESLLRDEDAEQKPGEFEPEEPDEEYEPEVPGEEYEFEEPGKEYEPEESDEEYETEPTPQDAAQKKPATRKRDLGTSAFTAMHRYIHEVKGEEKDRIQAVRERLDMEESALLALACEEGRR